MATNRALIFAELSKYRFLSWYDWRMILLCGNFQLNMGCSCVSPRGVACVGEEEWTAAGSLWLSVGKSTYSTPLGKVTDMAVCPCHLSLELHTSTETKGEPGDRDGSKAPACYCPQGLWANVGLLIFSPARAAQHGGQLHCSPHTQMFTQNLKDSVFFNIHSFTQLMQKKKKEFCLLWFFFLLAFVFATSTI